MSEGTNKVKVETILEVITLLHETRVYIRSRRIETNAYIL